MRSPIHPCHGFDLHNQLLFWMCNFAWAILSAMTSGVMVAKDVAVLWIPPHPLLFYVWHKPEPEPTIGLVKFSSRCLSAFSTGESCKLDLMVSALLTTYIIYGSFRRWLTFPTLFTTLQQRGGNCCDYSLITVMRKCFEWVYLQSCKLEIVTWKAPYLWTYNRWLFTEQLIRIKTLCDN